MLCITVSICFRGGPRRTDISSVKQFMLIFAYTCTVGLDVSTNRQVYTLCQIYVDFSSYASRGVLFIMYRYSYSCQWSINAVWIDIQSANDCMILELILFPVTIRQCYITRIVDRMLAISIISLILRSTINGWRLSTRNSVMCLQT